MWVSDVRSMFQQQAASRPVVSNSSFHSPSALPMDLSPIHKISSPSCAASTEHRPTAEQTTNKNVPEAIVNDYDDDLEDPNDEPSYNNSGAHQKQWDSPR
jgi:hypothetical protein